MSSKETHHVPPAQTTIKCDGCDTDFDIRWLCKNCRASLCDVCKAKHESDRFLGKHKIVSRTGRVIRELDSSKVSEICPKHPEQRISGYCNDCSAPVCMSCIEEGHRRHDVTAIESKYIECEDKLNDLATELKNNALAELQSSIKEFQEIFKSSENKFEDVKRKVNEYRQKLKTSVDTSCDELLSELELLKTESDGEISAVIKDLNNQIRDNERFISLCGQKIREGGLEVIKFSKVPPPQHLQTLPSVSRREPVFVPGKDLTKDIQYNIGEIRWEIEGAKSTTKGL